MIKYLALCLLINVSILNAQFAPPVGQIGTTAIYKDSSIIVSWATGCHVIRGWQDVSNTSAGETTVGDSTSAIGHADGINVVSLGDGGIAILTFQSPIKNGTGYDFCVFENSFDSGFLELAFVEVSSDGINFFRFPASSNTQTVTQIGPFDTTADATKLNNLAGKYIANYGTPFDLQDLQGTPGLDINNVTHVKIVDVVGSINELYATYDQNNNPINDPWPTAFPSGGFDLDAVGVINQQPVGIKEYKNEGDLIGVFPNPFQNSLSIHSNLDLISEVIVTDQLNNLIYASKPQTFITIINTEKLAPGFYFLKVVLTNNKEVIKKIIKP